MSETNHYLAFLAYCLNPERDVPKCVSAINWHALLSFARKHAITGVYGRVLLHDEKLQRDTGFLSNKPTDDDVLEWMALMVRLERRNRKINEYTIRTVDYLHEHGFDTCILKGQGNTLNYPSPFIRSAGDIDVWTVPTPEFKAKVKGWRRLLASDRMLTFSFVRSLYPEEPFKCQHIQFPIWADKGVEVEVHFYPMYVENLWNNRDLQRFFKQYWPEVRDNQHQLPDTKGMISCPTPFVNAVYQLTHINVHVLIEGIGLRQFIDYYYVLRNLPAVQRSEVKQWVKRIGLYPLARSVAWIEYAVLGLPEEYLYAEPDERRGRKLLKEIEIGGNFGHYDRRHRPENEGFWHTQFRKLVKHRDFVFDYPSEELSEPFFRLIHWIWRQWYQLKWKLCFRRVDLR